MAWNPAPEVAAARDVAKKLDAELVLVLYVTRGGKKLGMASYGETKELCKGAGKLGDKVFDYVMGLYK